MIVYILYVYMYIWINCVGFFKKKRCICVCSIYVFIVNYIVMVNICIWKKKMKCIEKDRFLIRYFYFFIILVEWKIVVRIV